MQKLSLYKLKVLCSKFFVDKFNFYGFKDPPPFTLNHSLPSHPIKKSIFLGTWIKINFLIVNIHRFFWEMIIFTSAMLLESEWYRMTVSYKTICTLTWCICIWCIAQMVKQLTADSVIQRSNPALGNYNFCHKRIQPVSTSCIRLGAFFNFRFFVGIWTHDLHATKPMCSNWAI